MVKYATPGVLTGFFGGGAVLTTGEDEGFNADNVLKKDVKIPGCGGG